MTPSWKTLPPSSGSGSGFLPLPTGVAATDTAALQAALDGGGLLRSSPLVVSPTYSSSAPLRLPSGITLDATGVTINLAPGSSCNMLNNAKVAADRSVSDAAITSGQPTLTSATAAFVAGDVGRKVGIAGAGPNGGHLYATIQTRNSATSVTLDVNANNTVSAATAYLYSASRDSDITVIGGTWNAGDNGTSDTYNENVFRFRRLDRLRIRDPKITGSNMTPGGGGFFGIDVGDITDFKIDDPFFNGNGDGVHVHGPASIGKINNVRGTTNDDMVAIHAGADQGSFADVEGDVSKIDVDGIYPNGSWTAFKALGGNAAGSGNRTLRQIRVRNILGTTAQSAVRIVDYGTGSPQLDVDVEVDGIEVVVGAGYSLIEVDAFLSQSVRMRNLTWPAAGPAATQGMVKVTKPTQHLRLDNVIHRGSVAGTQAVVMIGTSGTSGTITRLTINGLHVLNTPTIFGVWMQVPASAATRCVITDVSMPTALGALIRNDGPGTINAYLSDGFQGASPIYDCRTNGSNASSLHLTNWTNTHTFSARIQHPIKVKASNCTFSNSSVVFQHIGATATPCRYMLDSCAQEGAGPLVTRDGTQAISVHATGGPAVDQALLTPTDGDQILNSNATPLNGVGPAIYNAAAGKWKHMYTGTTS